MTDFDALPLPNEPEVFRMEGGHLFFRQSVIGVDLERREWVGLQNLWSDRLTNGRLKTYARFPLRCACAIAEVAFLRVAEQLQGALDAACATDNEDGSLNCNNCPCECAWSCAGQDVYNQAHDDMQPPYDAAVVWRAAGDAVRGEGR